MKFHLIGIKGSGMASLACVLHDLGHYVEGSDVADIIYTEKELKKRNIVIKQLNCSVRSDFIKIVSMGFHSEGIKYNTFIDMFFRQKKIAISGTHGKTTVSKMFSHVYNYTTISGDGLGYTNKKSPYLVIEACEYKDTFLKYHPDTLIINNIDYDHPDYFKSYNQLKESYSKLVNQSKKIIMNGDYTIFENKNVISFGFKHSNDIICRILKTYSDGYLLRVKYKEDKFILKLKHFGRHMIYNYLAVLSYALINKKNVYHITNKVNSFKLPYRRFEETSVNNKIIVCDYAHHPTEIKYLRNALNHKYPEKNITIIFQTHTHSRTKTFYKRFINELKQFDRVYIKKLFSSREEDKYIKSSDLLLGNNMFKRFVDVKSIKFKKDTIYLFCGAGDIDSDYKDFIKLCKSTI